MMKDIEKGRKFERQQARKDAQKGAEEKGRYERSGDLVLVFFHMLPFLLVLILLAMLAMSVILLVASAVALILCTVINLPLDGY